MQHRLKVLPESKLVGNQALSSSVCASYEDHGCHSFDPSFNQLSSTTRLITDQQTAPSHEYTDQTNIFCQPFDQRLDFKTSPDSRKAIFLSSYVPSRNSLPLKCPLCNLVTRTQVHLNEHMRREHSVLI